MITIFSSLVLGQLLVENASGDLANPRPASLEHRVLIEGPEAQRSFRDSVVEGLSFTIHNTSHLDFGDTERSSASDHQIVYSYPWIARKVLSVRAEGHRETVRCANDRYAFELRRSAPNAAWLVTGVGTTDTKAFLLSGASSLLSELSLKEWFCHKSLPLLDVEGVPVDRFFSSPGVEIRSVDADWKGRIGVGFVGDVATPTGPDRILGGMIWFSPDKYWSIDEYDIELSTTRRVDDASVSGKGRVRKSTEWIDLDGLPLPAVITIRYSGVPELDLPVVEQRLVYSNWKRMRYPEERFLLSHYGLPEPGLVAPAPQDRRWNVLVWVNLVGFVLILLGLGIAFRPRWKPGKRTGRLRDDG